MYLDFFLPFMVRVILGFLLFFQSYDIIFRIGMRQTSHTIYDATRQKGIPDWFANLSIYASTYIQLIGGALLIIGLFTPLAMIAIGINLIMVTVGFSYLKGIWDMKHVFPRLVLLIILFFIDAKTDILSLDALFNF